MERSYFFNVNILNGIVREMTECMLEPTSWAGLYFELVSHRQTLLEKSLVTLAVFPCAGRMQFDDV